MQRSAFELGVQRGEQIGERKGQLKTLVRAYELRFDRPLTDDERTMLGQRIEKLGTYRLLDVTYELAPDALAAWLADPAAT